MRDDGEGEGGRMEGRRWVNGGKMVGEWRGKDGRMEGRWWENGRKMVGEWKEDGGRMEGRWKMTEEVTECN